MKPPGVVTLWSVILVAVVPVMSPRSPKRNVVVGVVYLLVLWLLGTYASTILGTPTVVPGAVLLV